MDNANIERTEGKRRKRENENINRRKETLIKKAYELGEFDSIDVALIICKHGRYTTYSSNSSISQLLHIAEIQKAYPLPNILLPEDVQKRLANKRKEIIEDE
ncbi:hypothetical protein BKA65DRAFT_490007 [Rhexocercosporidium sp. MPI-PUGE-AT-0058]|nr:hypothetical protein BKA65DRAFT_490007 [Rhexocercosporidium sp. MPI-PUGE-AT-0058]